MIKSRPLTLAVFLAFLCVFSAGIVANADDSANPAAVNTPADKAKTDLARKLHMLNPLTDEVKDSINAIVNTYPEGSRETVRQTIFKSFDFVALNEKSIALMSEIFTEDELRALVEFHSKPEARSIAEKMPIYQKLLAPEIVKSLDASMMALRTGESAPAANSTADGAASKK